MTRKLLLLLVFATGSITDFAQSSINDRATEYIATYKDLAIAEQIRSGVPASITLAQGILETSGGQSELCSNASNHFGIKCKSTWTGETYAYTDDAKDECFRKYKCAQDSYKDHSDFLRNNKRYSSLFRIAPADYKQWAYGLKRCGYATNGQYAQKLIRYIEDYNLQEFTYAALRNEKDVLYAAANTDSRSRSKSVSTVVPGEHIPVSDAAYKASRVSNPGYAVSDEVYIERPTAQEERTTAEAKDYYVTTTKNGIKGFYAKKGDMLLEYAIKNKIRYAKLLEYNDLPDAPLTSDMFIYLSRKPKVAASATHTVREGESLLQISQEEGVQLEQLMAFNHLKSGQEPVPGSVLSLQALSDKVPDVYVESPESANTATTRVLPLSNDAGFVPAGKTATQQVRDIVAEDETDVEEADNKSEVKQNDYVNIANEKPVEEEFHDTRPAKKQTPVNKSQENMSALDKLKAHMDAVVYNDQEFEPKSSKSYEDTDLQKEDVTVPVKTNRVITTKSVANKTKVHVVKRGETLFAIAEKYGLTVKELQSLNHIKGSNIQVGTKLKVAK